jgi:hypothetical protein
VAIFDEDDAEHETCLDVSRSIRCPLITVWPVITEAMYLLSPSSQTQDRLWEFIAVGALRIAELAKEDAPRLRELMHKYADLPMDVADAALVRVAERENIRTVFTLDQSDFRVYAPSHIRAFRLLPP